MPNNSLKPLPADSFTFRHAQHLLNRAGFGGTPTQVRALANLGLDDAVDYIIEYDRVEGEPVRAEAFDSEIMRPATQEEREEQVLARRSGDEAALERIRREIQNRQQADRQQMAQVQQWWLKRMIETPRPLEEKLTLFWHGHFATGYRAVEDSFHMFLQNQLFRAHACGNFRVLTHQIIRDPAMLRFLNNNQNNRRRPNENLARELMELFTLGEGNGYSENDIKEGARALTGYTYRDDAFDFQRENHDDDTKRILGRSGEWDGDDFVDIIFDQRYASEYLCLKLYRYFVNDLPTGPDKNTQSFILDLAKLFREENFRVGPMLSTLFRSQHFYDEANMASQIKSPVQLIVQAVRSLHTPVRSLRALLSASDLMGQNLFFPPTVKGWDGGRAWINTSTLFVRQNLLIFLLTGRRPDAYPWQSDGSVYDATHLLAELRATGERPASRDAAIYLLRIMLGAEPHEARVAEIESFIESCGGRLENSVLVGALALIAAMPEYQLC